MKRITKVLVASIALLCFSTGVSHAFLVWKARNVMVPMRDGVKLAADIYFPLPFKKAPVIFIRTLYGKANGMPVGNTAAAPLFARSGYIVIVQDVRGRGRSHGEFYPFINDGADGADTIAWIRQRPWFNGRLGTMGISFLGIAQWFEAPGQDIEAMYGFFASADIDRVMSRGGQLNLLTVFNWAMLLGEGKNMNLRAILTLDKLAAYLDTLPLDDADDKALGDVNYYNDALDTTAIFELLGSIDITGKFPQITAPLFSVAGWYDMFLGPQLLDYQRMLEQGGGNANRSILIVGPWGHGPAGDGSVEFDNSSFAAAADEAAVSAWYDYWLRDSGSIEAMPRVLIYVMGKNVWRTEYEWPLARTEYRPYYLHSAGSANTATGDGSLSTDKPQNGEPSDTYTYNPLDPAPTLGGNNLITNVGPYDQRPVEERQDVLCYTTGVLTEDSEVTGPISAVLYAATDALDTDFTAKLVDVYPDGRVINIQDGIVRALYRNNDPLNPTPLTPGAVERYDIDLWATSVVFRKGHRIRVEISSSNFPRYNRNLNTGQAVPGATLSVTARQRIFHSVGYPSHILLPVIPGAGTP